jgi:hypothetical protein
MTMLNLNEARSKTPIKNINEKGSILPDLKSSLMFIPLKIRRACKNLSSGVEKGTLDPVKTPAVICGMAGAVLVAMPATNLRLAGFGCWIVANSLWVFQGVKVKDFYLMVLFGFYFLTAVLGVYNIT